MSKAMHIQMRIGFLKVHITELIALVEASSEPIDVVDLLKVKKALLYATRHCLPKQNTRLNERKGVLKLVK